VTDPSVQFKKLIDALERQLVNANETERRLHAQLQEMHFEDRFCCTASSIPHHKSLEALFLSHLCLMVGALAFTKFWRSTKLCAGMEIWNRS
jgi:hypothetical protein